MIWSLFCFVGSSCTSEVQEALYLSASTVSTTTLPGHNLDQDLPLEGKVTQANQTPAHGPRTGPRGAGRWSLGATTQRRDRALESSRLAPCRAVKLRVRRSCGVHTEVSGVLGEASGSGDWLSRRRDSYYRWAQVARRYRRVARGKSGSRYRRNACVNIVGVRVSGRVRRRSW